MWLSVAAFVLIVLIGGLAELWMERAEARYLKDSRSDLRPGVAGWLTAAVAPLIALSILAVSALMIEQSWTASALELALTFGVTSAFVALALYFLWSSYTTVFHRLRWDAKGLSRRTLFRREAYPLSAIRRIRANRFLYVVDFADGTRWYVTKLRGMERLRTSVMGGKTTPG